MTRTTLRALLCCLIISCLFSLQAISQESRSLVSRAKVTITPENAALVHQMEVDLTHGNYVPGRFLITDLSTQQIEHISALGFEVEILIPDVTEYYQTRQPQRNPLACQDADYNYRVPEFFANGSMGGYYTYSEILDALDLMQLLFPDLVSTRAEVGTEETHEGRSLFWVRLSDNAKTDEPEPEVLYTGLHHAREPMSMMQMIYFMWYLLEGYGTDPEATYLLNNTELYFIPCVNPDGYIYNQTIAPDGGGMWRKNKRDNNENGIFEESFDGVDLNRNYGYAWGHDNQGSSGSPGSEVYRGPAEFSEPESRAIRQFVEERDIRVALNYHAYGNYFLYPWGYTEDENPELTLFQNYGELMALDNGFDIGTSVETVGYPTNGSSDDWMYGEHNIYAMTPEVGHADDGFWPHRSEIIPLSQASLKNNLALAHLPHQFALATEINRDFFIGRDGSLDIRVKRYGSSLGDMVLTVLSLSPELTVEGTFHMLDIDVFEEQTASLDYSLDATAKGGEAYSFVIVLDNGFFEYRDTITKIFAGEILAFEEDGEALTEWTANGSLWGNTDETAYTGTTCMTDSPYGPSAVGAESVIALMDPIDLENAHHAVLEFWAKWEIEEWIDYAQVQVSTDGVSYHALCGQHSRLGSVFQAPEAVYDGIQTEWVHEAIDLTPYVGGQVYLRFILVTDIFESLDGIYVDDVRVYVYNEDISSNVSPGGLNAHLLNVWPNPSSDAFWVSVDEVPLTQGSRIVVMNAFGQVVTSEVPRGTAVRIEAEQFPAGMYFVHLFQDGLLSATRKVIVK